MRSPGRDGTNGVHWSALVASSGAWAMSKSGLSVLWVISSRSPAGSTSYSTPSRRGATTRGVASGVAASSRRISVVSLEPLATMMNRSSREEPRPVQNRGSASSKTSTSPSAGVPTSCRHTWNGRHESSIRVKKT